MSINMANEIIGHDEGLSKSYRRYDKQTIREEYCKVEPYLTVLAPANYADLQGTTQKELRAQQETTAALAAKMLSMEQELKELRTIIKASEER